jgi:hypothetical protein
MEMCRTNSRLLAASTVLPQMQLQTRGGSC